MVCLMKPILEALRIYHSIFKEDSVELKTETNQPGVVQQCPGQKIRSPIRYLVDDYADTVLCFLEQQVDHVANVCQILEPCNDLLGWPHMLYPVLGLLFLDI